MKKTALVCVVLFAAACGKKAEENKAPDPTAKIVTTEKKPEVGGARMALTTKSADAKAAYEKGHELALNARGAEAIEHMKKAVELDPEFAVATADLGMLTPGAEGTDLIAKAGPLAAKVTDAEKAWVEAAQAQRAGDPQKAVAALDKVAKAAPGQWEAHLGMGQTLLGRQDEAGAIKHLEQALAVNPNAAQVHNLLAYSYANKKEWDKAVASAKKQVELLPKEANPADTLAEIELWSGKFEDSEKNFLKATELNPKFFLAWQGVAIARAYRGDYKGAYEAYDKLATSDEPGQKYEANLERAWLQLTENKLPDALKSLDAIDKDPEAKKFPLYAFSAIERAQINGQSGKLADAKKALADALKRSESLAGDAKYNFMTGYRITALRIAMLEGKAAPDADKILADAETDGKRLGEDKLESSVQAYMRGLAAWAKGGAKEGPKAAIAELEKCKPEVLICRFDLAAAKRATGDTAGADAITAELKATPRRDAGAVFLLSRAGAK
jgi:tetratricopeptide (TPR) repeat protein